MLSGDSEIAGGKNKHRVAFISLYFLNRQTSVSEALNDIRCNAFIPLFTSDATLHTVLFASNEQRYAKYVLTIIV